MIISASRRTDIPAFFSDWFMNRISDGYFYRVNPFNTNQISGFSIEPKDVDTIIFWTKNPKPLLQHLPFLDKKSYNYYFQYTLNDYPQIFEPSLTDVSLSINTFKELSNHIGPQRVIWRYDPIILSNLTEINYHLSKFNMLANMLSNYTERVVISFVDLYGKVNSRWKDLTLDNTFSFYDVSQPAFIPELGELVSGLKAIAERYGLQIYTCAEHVDLEPWGIQHGACIDVSLINSLFNLELTAPKDKNQRNECLCASAIDMGMYNTCSHLCSYCYANLSETSVRNNLFKHNVNSPILVGECDQDVKIRREGPKPSSQLVLFD